MNAGQLRMLDFLSQCDIIGEDFRLPSNEDFKETIAIVYTNYLLNEISIEECKKILTPYRREVKINDICRSDETGSTC